MKQITLANDVAVIVRSSGERTESMCVELLRRQVPDDRIFLINARPFSKTLSLSYQKGLAIGKKWTLCLDADVLVFAGVVENSILRLTAQDEKTFGLSALLIDKFYGDARSRGFHLYRTDFLEKAINFVDEFSSDLRPETEVKNKMVANGYSWFGCPEIYGLHDFEQYYSDIFRKMATRAQKSPEHLDLLIKYSLTKLKKDKDYLVALWGLRFGSHLTHDYIKLDSRQWDKEIQTLLTCNEYTEKDALVVKNNMDIDIYLRQREKAFGMRAAFSKLKHSMRKIFI